jgi:hypothetical protein
MGKSSAYKTGTPFDDTGKRVLRMKHAKISKKRKMLLKRAREERLREAEVMKALRNKDKDALAVIATEVALSAISMV